MTTVTVVLLMVSVLSLTEAAGDWTYRDAQIWKYAYPMCDGLHQSPINIVERDTVYTQELRALRFASRRKQSSHTTVTNNGHTVSFSDLSRSYAVKLSGVYYKFDSIHFHWGLDEFHGSEHQLDGQAFSAEIHLLHYNPKYHTFADAASRDDGLAVLAVFLQESNYEYNPHYDCLRRAIDTVQFPSTKEVHCKIDPYRLVSRYREHFAYKGSLTTPPCTENVEWIVFKNVVEVSHEFMESLRKLMIDERHSIAPNYRPLQQINGRHVYRSFEIENVVGAPVSIPQQQAYQQSQDKPAAYQQSGAVPPCG